MLEGSQIEYTEGIMPGEFFIFIKLTAILGFLAALALTSALVYKGIEKLVGPEGAKKYRWVVVVGDMVIFFVFLFIYLIFF
jgi:hypothetical protein